MLDARGLNRDDEPMPSHAAAEPRVHALQNELRQRGLPLVLGPRARLVRLVPRSASALMGGFLFMLGIHLFAAGVAEMSANELATPTESKAIAAGSGLLLVLAFPVGWWLVQVLLRFLPFVVGTVLGIALIEAILTLPFVHPGTLGTSLPDALVVIVVILLATYWGVGTVMAWAFRRAARELNHLGSMVGRVLPTLMLALLFSFFNTEIRQVVGQLSMGRKWGSWRPWGSRSPRSTPGTRSPRSSARTRTVPVPETCGSPNASTSPRCVCSSVSSR